MCRSKAHNPFEAHANFISRSYYGINTAGSWVVDSGASHHITDSPYNLQYAFEFSSNEEIIIGDGNGISITHIAVLLFPLLLILLPYN